DCPAWDMYCCFFNCFATLCGDKPLLQNLQNIAWRSVCDPYNNYHTWNNRVCHPGNNGMDIDSKEVCDEMYDIWKTLGCRFLINENAGV
ncbi:MAG: hypothetical protein ILO42_02050, partial [Clostridia bacterium]|nr:hypothetical protein [Clostridia bacterium]